MGEAARVGCGIGEAARSEEQEVLLFGAHGGEDVGAEVGEGAEGAVDLVAVVDDDGGRGPGGGVSPAAANAVVAGCCCGCCCRCWSAAGGRRVGFE